MYLGRWFAPLVVLALLASAVVTPVAAQPPTPLLLDSQPVRRPKHDRAFVPGEVLVQLHNGSSLVAKGAANTQTVRARFASFGAEAATTVAPRTYKLELGPTADVAAAAARLAADPEVAFAQPNYIRHAYRGVNDPLSTFQYALSRVNAFGAWDLTTGNSSVVIAVVDTGVNASHPDFTGRVLPGFDFVNNDSDANDDEGHGTHTAGIIAAAGDNGEGIAGLCWQCRILPVKVLNYEGAGTDAWVASGIRWAADHGARVINLSLGGEDDAPIIRDAVRYATSKNALMVVAAGNSADRGNPVEYPAAYDEVLAVGATDDKDQRAFFSSVQPYVDVTAPGWNIPSTINQNSVPYLAASGTSEAAPHVAGLAGLLLSRSPSLDVNALRSVITSTADDLGPGGPDSEYGAGRINAGRAVASVQAPGFEPVPNPNLPGVAYFPETQHTLRGEFRRFWEQNGGLPVFGFPITEEFTETSAEGTFAVQYFERNRFEYHPEKSPPYNVLLGRLSDTQLRQQGRDWFTFPKGQPTEGCQFFPETGHAVCEPFLSYWKRNGLRDPQLAPDGRSLALFGLPLSEPALEVNSSGQNVLTQWFERARFEHHPDKPAEYQVLLGLLGNETARSGAGSTPGSGQTPADRCGIVPPSENAVVAPGSCIVIGTFLTVEGANFAPGEEITFYVGREDGRISQQRPLRANAQGRAGFGAMFPFPPGVYGLVMQGTQSGVKSVTYVRVIDR